MTKSKHAQLRDDVVDAARRCRAAVARDDRQAWAEAHHDLMLTVDAYAGHLGPIDGEPASVLGAPATSRAAAKQVWPAARSVRRGILMELATRADGLATDEMLERAMRCKHQTLSSARNHLVLAGWVEDSRYRQDGRVLWQLTEAAKTHLRTEGEAIGHS